MREAERRAKLFLRVLRASFSDAEIRTAVRRFRITGTCARWIDHDHEHQPLRGCLIHELRP